MSFPSPIPAPYAHPDLRASTLPTAPNTPKVFGSYSIEVGRDTVRANGFDPDSRPVVFTHSYTTAEYDPKSNQHYPPNLTPCPETDYPTQFVAAAATRKGEICLTLPLQPGLERYYRLRGVLEPEAKLWEVNPEVDPAAPQKLGWPSTDVLLLALRSQPARLDRAYFVESLPTERNRAIARQLGMLPVQQSLAEFTNNKVRFQEDAPAYNINVLKGAVVRSSADIARFVETYGSAARIWVKHPNAAGGDAVAPLEGPLTVERVTAACQKMATLIDDTVHVTDFSRAGLERISEGTVLQLDGSIDPVKLQQDRTIRFIGGCLFEVGYDGSTRIHSHHLQNTGGSGVFNGSSPFEYPPAVTAAINQEIQNVGNYCSESLKLFGPLGVDFLVVEDSSGNLHVELIELNGRPNATTFSRVIAEKLGAYCWNQVNVTAPHDLHTLADLAALIGEETLFENKGGPQFIPLAFQTLCTILPDGSRQSVASSPKVKLLILGDTPADVERGVQYLQQRGLRL